MLLLLMMMLNCVHVICNRRCSSRRIKTRAEPSTATNCEELCMRSVIMIVIRSTAQCVAVGSVCRDQQLITVVYSMYSILHQCTDNHTSTPPPDCRLSYVAELSFSPADERHKREQTDPKTSCMGLIYCRPTHTPPAAGKRPFQAYN